MLTLNTTFSMERQGWQFKHVGVPSMGVTCLGRALNGTCICRILVTAEEICSASGGLIVTRHLKNGVYEASTPSFVGTVALRIVGDEAEAAALVWCSLRSSGRVARIPC
jgi:hypothetical protein